MKRSQTFLSFDFGIKSIGVASGQNVTGTAAPLKTLKAQNGVPSLDEMDILFEEWKPTKIVVGLPLNMDGSEQPLTDCARQFAHFICTRYKILVNLHDERLSTIEARDMLFKQKGFQALRKDHIDSFSAVIILEGWIESTLSGSII
ncbi:Holliday junction resolvase RuvX [Candidatus Erwinia haradaeae]|uniref:Putative pre-16S rRNA nuclease n=1 Tax=Candidatus Erwinia haradaeae TaxID=1922217 RepID=A0A451D245_9GAMM|nr:Holliday junction resolvase RuvX [Candidatus Erwinia haradaeae]VFP79671.1 Putative pre-16S rRNA nuclease [Candidatus Erwinia haradaeae]